MQEFIIFDDCELWDIICDGLFVPIKKEKTRGITIITIKIVKKYNDIDREIINKNLKVKRFLVDNISPKEYNKVSSCETANKIKTKVYP